MAAADPEADLFDIAIPQVPVTKLRQPFIQEPGHIKLKQAGTARANEAASVEAPRGSQGPYFDNHRHQTVLQQHVAFFDTDNDGVIWPLDTFYNFRRLDFNLFLSIFSMFVIHFAFSYPTLPGYFPDPFFRIYVNRIHRDKHGSDSGSYDAEGRFEPQKFEDIFAKYATGDRQGITFGQIIQYIRGQRVIADPFGWFAAVFEWTATYILLWPADGRMMKEDIRRVYDGSIFYEIASRRSKSH